MYQPLGAVTVEWGKPWLSPSGFGPFVSREPLRGLEGLGTDCPWYERWAFGGRCGADVAADRSGVTAEGDTSDFTPEEIRAYIEAAPAGSTVRFSSGEHTTTTTTTAPAPESPSRVNWFVYGSLAALALALFAWR